MTFKATEKLNIKELISDRVHAHGMNSRNDQEYNISEETKGITQEIMLTIKNELVEAIEEYFPKGKSKELGDALMLLKILQGLEL